MEPEKMLKKHPQKRWEVSLIKLQEDERIFYKVTRRLPEMSVAETKLFESKEDAKKQFEEWMTD